MLLSVEDLHWCDASSIELIERPSECATWSLRFSGGGGHAILHRLEECASLGVNRVLLPIPDEPRDAVLGVLDSYTEIVERFS